MHARSEDVGTMLCGELGGATLTQTRGEYYVNATVELPTPPVHAVATWVGVDRGRKNLAVARAPKRPPLVIRGGHIDAYRLKARNTRQRLQNKGTPSALRVLRDLGAKEQRFVLDASRCAAKNVIQYAKQHNAGIALEELDGIRDTAKTNGSQGRFWLHTWAYNVFHACLLNLAEKEGIPVTYVPAPYTSRTCPQCYDARKSNRVGSRFECRHAPCGYRNHADVVAATNIARYATVLSTMASEDRGPVNDPHGRAKTNRTPTRVRHFRATPKKTTTGGIMPPASASG